MTFFFSKRGPSVKPEANKMATCGGGKWAGIGAGVFWARAWISMAGSQAIHHKYCQDYGLNKMRKGEVSCAIFELQMSFYILRN